jgi:hypothetical protein
MTRTFSGGRRSSALTFTTVALLTLAAACTNPWRPTPTTTTTTSTSTTTTTAPGHEHDNPADAPYISPDDPRLTPDQQRRAKDLIARTEAAMRAFPDQASVVRAGYESIRDSLSGYEHFFHYGYMADGRELDPAHIEAIVLETKPGQPKRVVAAMYMLDNGKTFADVPEIAGPLTPWHNHKDLCWDPSGKYMQGIFRLGRCIPAGTVKELNPMLHIWVVPNECGPFAEVDDTNNPIDAYLRQQGLMPPAPTGCARVHGGDHG